MNSLQKLQQLFKEYQSAFIQYDLNSLSSTYHLPCTLNTPDKILLIQNETDLKNELNNIFSQLKSAKINNVVAKKSSYMSLSPQLFLVCVEWEFLDEEGEVFTDFSAVYHVLNAGNSLKIINVISHELESALQLSELLTW